MGRLKKKPLNAKQIERAKHVGRGFTILRDGNGLELRVIASGRKTWHLRYTSPVTGKIRVPRFAVYGKNGQGIELAEARREAAAFRYEISQGKDPFPDNAKPAAPEKNPSNDSIEADGLLTFDEALTKFEKYLLARREVSGAESIRVIRKDALPILRGIPVCQIRRGLLVEAVDAPMARGAKRIASRLFKDLKQMFSWLELREYIDKNPLRPYKVSDLVGEETERDRFLETSEAVLLLRLMPSSGLSRIAQIALLLILATGCRPGEIRQCRWDFVDFEQRLLVLPAWLTKPRVEHRVHLSDIALRCLSVLYRETGHSAYFFPSPIKQAPLGHTWLMQHVRDRQIDDKRRCDKRTTNTGSLALPKGRWKPHDLRRTVASTMAALGIFPEVIERVLNHQEPNRMKRIYNRYSYAPEKAKAWDAMGAELERWLDLAKIDDVDVLSNIEAQQEEDGLD